MKISEFQNFVNSATQSGMIYSFSGEISRNAVEHAQSYLKDRLVEDELTGAIRRRLFSTFVEMVQNILHYSPVNNKGNVHEGVIAVGKNFTEEGGYWIACANRVQSQFIAEIQRKLEPLQTLTMDEIKARYREQLRNENHGEDNPLSKGAGLGFLTIARDSARPIEFDFTPAPQVEGDEDNVGNSYFLIRAVVF